MTPEEAINPLKTSCIEDRAGRYFLSCKSGFVVVKLQGIDEPLLFPARYKIAFRIGEQGLQIERLDRGSVEKTLQWNEIESLAAGEPESAGGMLFQG